MINTNNLAQEYYRKSKIRLKALYVLRDEGGFSDVIRESQELVELLLKGLLRLVAIEPPKWHDVSSILNDNKERLSAPVQNCLDRITKLSKYLRKERELSFYGDEDYLPSEEYCKEDADFCVSEVEWLLALLAKEFENE